MGFLPGEARRRARRELQEALESITYRLDHLESAPPPKYDLERLRGIMAGVSGQTNDRLDALDLAVRAVASISETTDQRLKDLTLAVAEGIERVARSERRIHAVIKRARKELAEHGFESPGLETEAAELQLADGKGSEPTELPTVPKTLEPSSIKGVPAETLRRVRGW